MPLKDADLLVIHAAQLVTCAGPAGPRRGAAMRAVALIPDGALAIQGGEILAAGTTEEILAAYQGRRTLDASGKVVCPGFVDPHTHVVYAGQRIAEFELRIQGATYMEIMDAGGGIVSTMRATRLAPVESLMRQSRGRLDQMLALGTTTAEAKTGYGLDVESELHMLEAIAGLDQSHPLDLVPTFLGAHAVPPEYQGQTGGYVDLVVEQMIPRAAEWYAGSHFAQDGVPFFCDVFCEAGVFDLEQSRRVLEAGLRYGMRPKIHADEFKNLGGVSLAVELGAVSADHLDVTPPEEVAWLAQSDTVGVALPVVNFNLGSLHYADARGLIDAGAAIALSTDINPGSAPCPSMPIVMNIACRYQRLLPSEALIASTINAAYAVGLGARVGSLEPGKQADLLVLSATDYRLLAYQIGGNLVETVIKRGEIIA